MISDKYDYVIWDWNGTLYDDVAVSVSVINTILGDRKMPALTEERYRRIFCFPVIDYYKKLGFDFNKENFKDLANVFVDRYNGGAIKSKLRRGAAVALDYISKAQTKQIILSASKLEHLSQQMAPFGIANCFDEILGQTDFFATGKHEIARRWFNANNVSPERVVLVGDTLHDFDVADANGCNCVLVSGGHQHEELLLSTGAAVFQGIDAVVEYFKSL